MRNRIASLRGMAKEVSLLAMFAFAFMKFRDILVPFSASYVSSSAGDIIELLSFKVVIEDCTSSLNGRLLEPSWLKVLIEDFTSSLSGKRETLSFSGRFLCWSCLRHFQVSLQAPRFFYKDVLMLPFVFTTLYRDLVLILELIERSPVPSESAGRTMLPVKSRSLPHFGDGLFCSLVHNC